MGSAKAIARSLYRNLKTAGLRRRVPTIVRVLPHDPDAYTQGLACVDGLLYESSGGTQSTIRCIDASDGGVRKIVPVEGVWAEGIAASGRTLTLLTWKHEVAFVYSLPELERGGEFRYQGEGWGLAANEHGYVMTDGSSNVQVRSARFELMATIPVRMNGLPVRHLNDVEIVREIIYANVWYSTDILEISARTGQVLGLVDCSRLRDIERPSSPDHVLNGIAYDAVSETFFVTGKCWKHLFQVRFTS